MVRLAFNLYCGGTPSENDYEKKDEKIAECRLYSVDDIFSCAYAPFFWQAVQIRYPEDAVYNYKLNALYGSRD